MNGTLDGKSALVTGGAGGFGKACALAVAHGGGLDIVSARGSPGRASRQTAATSCAARRAAERHRIARACRFS